MTGIRILVIDDDPLQLELVDRALSRDGFELRGVTSIDGLDAVTREFSPQLVLLDVNMPDTEPERVIALVRAAAGTARIVLYSAWEDSKLRKLAASVGADAYLTKSESVFAIGGKLRDLAGR
ncbi:MAG: response regulator [Kofleriaceae bacterium]|nr:response regulator [Kofleriaceae bacterium]